MMFFLQMDGVSLKHLKKYVKLNHRLFKTVMEYNNRNLIDYILTDITHNIWLQ